jgi:hypothetical protein
MAFGIRRGLAAAPDDQHIHLFDFQRCWMIFPAKLSLFRWSLL